LVRPAAGRPRHLDRAGYDTSLVRRYDRRAIAAPWWRVKEWDYYLITCPRFAVALTIADTLHGAGKRVPARL
jgi:hypothetical protein